MQVPVYNFLDRYNSTIINTNPPTAHPTMTPRPMSDCEPPLSSTIMDVLVALMTPIEPAQQRILTKSKVQDTLCVANTNGLVVKGSQSQTNVHSFRSSTFWMSRGLLQYALL
jgi:hypothetical protein